MSNFKVVPIPHHIAKAIRAKLVDEQGHRLQATPVGNQKRQEEFSFDVAVLQ
ncbi:MAG: hypothetical protein ACRENG_19730 [bacterium]